MCAFPHQSMHGEGDGARLNQENTTTFCYRVRARSTDATRGGPFDEVDMVLDSTQDQKETAPTRSQEKERRSL